MPRAPRDKEAATPTPKKRTRKAAAPKDGNGIHADNGKGALAAPQTNITPSLEEQIRLRAYHLYLQRGGRNGSPEQDWFRAQEEIYREQSIA